MLLFVLLSCASGIRSSYEAERAAALAEPTPAPEHWQPDLRFRVAPTSLERLVTGAVERGLGGGTPVLAVEGPLGVKGSLEPEVGVTSLSLSPGTDCAACLQVDATLDGKARWALGPTTGTVPFTARLAGTVAFAVEAGAPGTWTVVGRLTDLGRLSVESVDLGRKIDVTDPLEGWTREAAAQAPPFTLGEFGADDLPVRALRLATTAGAIEVQALSDVAGGAPVAAGLRPLRDGWELRFSQATLLALVRRQAFETGTVAYDVAVDPRALALQGEGFALDLRLWRLAGRGWWRDYHVEGGLLVEEGRIHMRPTNASEGDKSAGAGLADPLALLAEGRLLEAVSDGCEATLPGRRKARVGALRVAATVESARGDGDALVVRGTLEVEE